MPVSERIGIFGGTFDPPHIGHLASAVNVFHGLGLQRMLLVVANSPWQKVGARPLTEAYHRMEMVRHAVVGLDCLEASDLEVRRGGPSYTADTLHELSAPGRELVVVLGSDAAAGLPTWERVDEVAALATVAVVERPGQVAEAHPPGFRIERVEVPELRVSSTDLRRRVAEGRPIDVLVPARVADYVHRHRLYGGSR